MQLLVASRNRHKLKEIAAIIADLNLDVRGAADIPGLPEIVETVLSKYVSGVGLERVDPAGQPFDPNVHEAVMTMPAVSAAADHTVGTVFQPGYRLNGLLIRPARVAVLTWTEPATEGAAQ